MAELTNKSNKEELLNQIKAYLNSTELCASVFTKNPKYLPYCEAQRTNSSAQVTGLIRKQVETLTPTAENFLTTSYSLDRKNQSRNKL